jgi:hypothetical protein
MAAARSHQMEMTGPPTEAASSGNPSGELALWGLEHVGVRSDLAGCINPL